MHTSALLLVNELDTSFAARCCLVTLFNELLRPNECNELLEKSQRDDSGDGSDDNSDNDIAPVQEAAQDSAARTAAGSASSMRPLPRGLRQLRPRGA